MLRAHRRKRAISFRAWGRRGNRLTSYAPLDSLPLIFLERSNIRKNVCVCKCEWVEIGKKECVDFCRTAGVDIALANTKDKTTLNCASIRADSCRALERIRFTWPLQLHSNLP